MHPTAAAAQEFCLRLVKATAPYAAAFKPNAAFFEALGPEGWTALKAVIDAVHGESVRLGSRIPVILDAKRGDIASTAEAYARSAFEMLGADAITLSPYLGRDSIEPFIRDREKGAFLLCKTSNAGSRRYSGRARRGRDSTRPLYSHVASLAAQWNTHGNVGIVVGANYPETLAEVRQLVPDLWFLVPGVGRRAATWRPLSRPACGLMARRPHQRLPRPRPCADPTEGRRRVPRRNPHQAPREARSGAACWLLSCSARRPRTRS